MPKKSQLRDNPIWKDANSIAEFMYQKVIPNIDSVDEKWGTERKIRNAANDMVFYVAQALGATNPGFAEYDWSYARKTLFGLQTIYLFGAKQSMYKLDPEYVVMMDNMIVAIDEQVKIGQKFEEENNKKELEPWLEKYRLWKAMNPES